MHSFLFLQRAGWVMKISSQDPNYDVVMRAFERGGAEQRKTSNKRLRWEAHKHHNIIRCFTVYAHASRTPYAEHKLAAAIEQALQLIRWPSPATTSIITSILYSKLSIRLTGSLTIPWQTMTITWIWSFSLRGHLSLSKGEWHAFLFTKEPNWHTTIIPTSRRRRLSIGLLAFRPIENCTKQTKVIFTQKLQRSVKLHGKEDRRPIPRHTSQCLLVNGALPHFSVPGFDGSWADKHHRKRWQKLHQSMELKWRVWKINKSNESE